MQKTPKLDIYEQDIEDHYNSLVSIKNKKFLKASLIAAAELYCKTNQLLPPTKEILD